MKKVLILVIGVSILVVGVIVLKAVQIADLIGFAKKLEEEGPPPVSVATALVEKDEWESVLNFPGTVRPVEGVMLSAEVGGTVVEIAVENGASVRRSDLLLRLDTSVEEALLAEAEARLKLASIKLERTRGLLEKRIVPQQEYDSAEAEFEIATAQESQLRAQIAKKVFRAPFDGRVGIRLVNLGQTVKPGDQLIPLYQNDPIYVEFAVPQNLLPQIYPGQPLRVKDNGQPPLLGQISAINPVVEETTRTARVQALVPNPTGQLRAGQFVEVEVLLAQKIPVLRIPQTAILSEAYGDSVFVIEEKNGKLIANQRFIQAGQKLGDFVAVEKGLQPGDRVVSAGAFKLRNGSPVTIHDSLQPTPSLHPSPAEG